MWGCKEPCTARKINGKTLLKGSKVKHPRYGLGTVISTGCSYGHFPDIRWDDGKFSEEFTDVTRLEIINLSLVGD